MQYTHKFPEIIWCNSPEIRMRERQPALRQRHFLLRHERLPRDRCQVERTFTDAIVSANLLAYVKYSRERDHDMKAII